MIHLQIIRNIDLRTEIVFLLIMNIMTTYGHIIIKYSSPSLSSDKNIQAFLKQLTAPLLLSGITAVMAAPFFYFNALKTMDLNIAYSFTALNQIIIPGVSIFIFKEKINIQKIFAIILITTGIIIWNI